MCMPTPSGPCVFVPHVGASPISTKIIPILNTDSGISIPDVMSVHYLTIANGDRTAA